MRAWFWRITFILLFAGAGFLVYQHFFPNEQKVIRRRFQEMAALASFKPNEGALAKLSNAQKLSSFFTADVEVMIDVPNQPRAMISGREDLMKGAVAARNMLPSLSVNFVDIEVTLQSNQTAVANLTARAQLPSERDMWIQELKAYLRKVDGTWLIYKVETIKTLSDRPSI